MGQRERMALPISPRLWTRVAAKATVHAQVRLDAVIADPPDPPNTPRPGADYARLVALLEAHPDLADALRYLEEEPDMRGHYKVAEAIRLAVGSKWNTLVSLGWTTDAELRRFRQSTQPRRHHKGRAPDKPLTEAQADTYVRTLLAKLITHLDS